MGMELKMLLWAVVLGLVQVVLAATLATGQRGLGWMQARAMSHRGRSPALLAGLIVPRIISSRPSAFLP